MFISFQRVVKSGFEKFIRDRSSTGAALVVMAIVLFVVSSLYILQGMSLFLIDTLEDNVDVSAYFTEETLEDDIFQVREALLEIEEVESVEYVSKDEALRRFLETHKDDVAILEPLSALGSNPLRASLNIKAQEATQYELISEFLGDEAYSSFIETIDFHDRAPVIDRLLLLTGGIRTGVLAVIIGLSLIAMLIAFNTIRLTIYSSKDEIEVMRLVGASNWFIRGPFLVQGILVGVVATLVTLALLFALSYMTGTQIEEFTGFNIQAFLQAQFFVLLGLQLVVGIGLGVLSSSIAIGRYLKV